MQEKTDPSGPLTVAALLHEDILASSVTLPMEILYGAAQALGRRTTQHVDLQCYAQSTELIRLQGGLTLGVKPLEYVQNPDLLLVPAIWRQPLRVVRRHREQIELIAQHISRGALTISVGSGSFLLAETGLLSGRSATTHWHWFDTFAKRYPSVRLERQQLITQSENIFCVGSVNSVADLMVYLCAELFSPRVAQHIENQFSPEIRRRFSPSPLGTPRARHDDELIVDAQLELARNLRVAPPLPVLAAQLGVSARTLARRFRVATGMTPGRYLQKLRLDEAQVLLRRTNLSITEVGLLVGLGDPSHFARTFRTEVGMSPSAYRGAVRGKLFVTP
jgi:transcriptional regulator GlxA family with amidase domain